jgi:hypothetical protein
MTEEDFKDLLSKLIACRFFYIVIKTKFTTHHIERLSSSVKDRGNWKWIAESECLNVPYGEDLEEFYRSHIDGSDLFPRYYFLDESLIKEFFAWIHARKLTILDISTPKI